MKKRDLIVFILLFFLSPFLAPSLFPAPDTQTPPAGPAIPFGEHLVYDIYWFGRQVGTGEVEVGQKTIDKGRVVFNVVGTAQANDFLENIYPVHDQVQSWIDASTLESLQFEKKIDENGNQSDEVDVFDAVSKKGRHLSLKSGEKKDFSIALPAQDVASAVYWVRRQKLVPGQSPFKIVLSCNQKNWELEIKAIRRETKKLRGLGVVDSILVVPRLRVNGVLDTRGKAWVYLKNDAFHTPFLVKVQTPFGPVLGLLRPPQINEPLGPKSRKDDLPSNE